MGLRGPRPLTNKMLKLRGSWRANANKDQPQPLAGAPTCPAWLDKDAKRAWRRLIPQLVFMGVVTQADRNALARYCQTWARWKKAEEFIQKYGETYPLKDEKGNVKCFMPWPQVSISNQMSQTLTRLEQEFGLTPSARTRINVNNVAPVDPERAKWVSDFFSCGGSAPPRSAGASG